MDAPRLAAILARHGLNGVRFHYFDRPAPGGILDAARGDTRGLDAEELDRFDFLVAELKKRGIYTNINLNVARRNREGDGVRDHELLGFAKGLTHFDERLIHLEVAVENDFAAVTLSALDDRPLSRSARLLLTAGALVANSGMRWNDDCTGLLEWGGAPTVIEPVRGRVVLRGLEPATHVVVTALDSGGRRTGAPRPAHRTDDGWEVELGLPATVWSVVDVGR